MENQKHAQNQGLLDALESLSAALSVVSSSVDMVREELQAVLSMLTDEPGVEKANAVSTTRIAVSNKRPSALDVENSVSAGPVSEGAVREKTPPIYLLTSLPDNVPVISTMSSALHEMERQECLTCAV